MQLGLIIYILAPTSWFRYSSDLDRRRPHGMHEVRMSYITLATFGVRDIGYRMFHRSFYRFLVTISGIPHLGTFETLTIFSFTYDAKYQTFIQNYYFCLCILKTWIFSPKITSYHYPVSSLQVRISIWLANNSQFIAYFQFLYCDSSISDHVQT